MALSMTGFGRATGKLGEESYTVELSAVNHRFLDCFFRLPYSWTPLEPRLREAVKRCISRGKVTVNVRRDRGVSGPPVVRCDTDVAKQYLAASRQLAEVMSTTEALSLNTLVNLEGVFYQEEQEEDLEAVFASLQDTLDRACEQLHRGRAEEGQALAEDVVRRIREMRDALSVVEARIPEIVQAYEERLRARVAELNAEAGLAEDRLALEVALLAEKSDVNEEVVRLKAHFDHAEEVLGREAPVGRELNFLCQEVQREVNTLGSKLRDIGVTREILRMKSELEKVREQAQNLE